MRKVLLVVAMLAVALAATPASAGTITDASLLPTGDYQAKFSGFSDLYTPSPTGSGNGTPERFGLTGAALTAGIGTLENRAIFNTTSIQTLAPVTVWNGSSQSLTGLFYDLTLAGVTQQGSALVLDFDVSSRTSPLSGPGLATSPANSGGVVQVYAQAAPNAFNADPASGGSLHPAPTSGKLVSSVNGTPPVSNGKWGPAQWVQGATVSSSDTYAPNSNGTLWLSGEFVRFSDVGVTAVDGDPNTVFEESINLNLGGGSGFGYIHLVGGSDFARISKGDVGYGPAVDMLLNSDLSIPATNVAGTKFTGHNGTSYGGAGYWPADANDPLTFSVVPEPVSIIFFGTGLVAVGGYVARRRMLRKA
jgi:hypothetical protein